MTQQIEALASKLDSVPGTPGPAALEVFGGVSAPMSPKDLVPSSGLHENRTYTHKPVGMSIPAPQHTHTLKKRKQEYKHVSWAL